MSALSPSPLWSRLVACSTSISSPTAAVIRQPDDISTQVITCIRRRLSRLRVLPWHQLSSFSCLLGKAGNRSGQCTAGGGGAHWGFSFLKESLCRPTAASASTDGEAYPNKFQTSWQDNAAPLSQYQKHKTFIVKSWQAGKRSLVVWQSTLTTHTWNV